MGTKYYYAFIGQNATTGSPNRKTGLMSLFGEKKVRVIKKPKKEGELQ